MKIPPAINNLIDAFERLPGIGPKTAQRLTFYLLHVPQEEIQRFAEALNHLKTDTRLCSICKNVSEGELCAVCQDETRDKNIIIVVANILDVFAIERTGYKGQYHVLHGIIDPLNNINPEELYINELITRLQKLKSATVEDSGLFSGARGAIELVLATNSTMEGESTAMYISKLIKDSGFTTDQVKVTRIARGLPVGGDIEYADDITLRRALEGRNTFES